MEHVNAREAGTSAAEFHRYGDGPKPLRRNQALSVWSCGRVSMDPSEEFPTLSPRPNENLIAQVPLQNPDNVLEVPVLWL